MEEAFKLRSHQSEARGKLSEEDSQSLTTDIIEETKKIEDAL